MITDGVFALPDAITVDSLLAQLRASTVCCSFIKVGSGFHAHCRLILLDIQFKILYWCGLCCCFFRFNVFHKRFPVFCNSIIDQTVSKWLFPTLQFFLQVLFIGVYCYHVLINFQVLLY